MRAIFTAALVLIDANMSMLGFYIAYRLRVLTRGETVIGPFTDYITLAGILVVATLLSFFFYKSYHRRRTASAIDELTHIFAAVSVATILTIAFVAFALRNTLEYQRSMIMYGWGASLVTITFGRYLHGRWQHWVQRRGRGMERVLIVGTGEVGRTILQKIHYTPSLGYQVVGFVDCNPGPERVLDLPFLGDVGQLPAIIEKHHVDEVIIGLPEATHQELVGIIANCEREKVTIRVFPDVFQIMASEVTIGDLGGLPLLTVRDVALRGWKLTLKRIVDIVISGILLLLLSPFLVLVAILIKLDSPGPALFIQDRMGLDAKPFPIIKFRSMRQDAEAQSTWTVENDPRRTRVGTFIRKTSVDEFPQLINVLLGDMSLVGPRPEQPSYVEQFQQSIPRYMDRHREKAGMTGWAQVNGLRGNTSIEERTKYDLWYIENWSLWLDFKILIRTGLKFLGDRSAY